MFDKAKAEMIRPWFRQAAVPWKTTATQTRASGENRVSTKLGVLQVEVAEVLPEVDGDAGIGQAGGDSQDGPLGGGAGQLPGLQGADGGGPPDHRERLPGGDGGPGGEPGGQQEEQ